MSFDLYFAGAPNLELNKYMMSKGCCRLQSQLNERRGAQLWIDYTKEHSGIKVFIDSGAFSAWSKGKPLPQPRRDEEYGIRLFVGIQQEN